MRPNVNKKNGHVRGKQRRPVWFARGGGISKMGPYPSYEKAAQALITTEGVPIEGAFVWPETPSKKAAL